MFEALDSFVKVWLARLRLFCYLTATWAVFFSVFTIMGLRAGFEYDDGLVFSAQAYRAAAELKAPPSSQDYWNAVNRGHPLERVKPAVWLTAWTLRCLGFKVAIICQRGPAGSDTLMRSWGRLAGEFLFAGSEIEKYELLEKTPFTVYFGVTDSDIIQARKAGVWAVRIRKSAKSALPGEASPRKFKEPVLPLSEF